MFTAVTASYTTAGDVTGSGTLTARRTQSCYGDVTVTSAADPAFGPVATPEPSVIAVLGAAAFDVRALRRRRIA
jgi:hypothetical protein